MLKNLEKEIRSYGVIALVPLHHFDAAGFLGDIVL
jgi:hypothetical protein